MTYSSIIGMNVCDDCHKPQSQQRDTMAIWWASGWRHYCEQCWPEHRDYYDSESGRRAWKQIGNCYEPIE
jgi:hypothetical protein